MNNIEKTAHWETIYNTRNLEEVSWYQPTPETSLRLINELSLSKDCQLIDIGAGNSFLVDYLMEDGYQHITVLDISETAITKTKDRLGKNAVRVNWIVGDVTKVELQQSYDIWHDRAAFHFLNTEDEIESYIEKVKRHIKPGGYLIISTFSEKGPKKCSGISIKQYSKNQLADTFKSDFKAINCFEEMHKTPKNQLQHFSFCVLKRIE